MNKEVIRPVSQEDIIRFYFAITNFCNRACELCSCHSDPTKKTFLSFDEFKSIIENGIFEAQNNGKSGSYESQLEGGEPTVAPEFWNMVKFNLEDSLCKKIILCTNAVKIPYSKNQKKSIEEIKKWILKFSVKPFILKPSINSHLINNSSVHMEKCRDIMLAWNELEKDKLLKDGSMLIFNVRLIPKPMTEDGEQNIIDNIEKYNLTKYCNIFEYQRYGKAKNEDLLKEPYIISNPVKFYLISPDGKNFDNDLINRANYMENLK